LVFRQLRNRYGQRIDGATRREFLRGSVAAGTALLLSGPLALAQVKPNGKSVVVIGAGFSGLAAAYELASVGYAVTVVDACNRIGGRVVTFKDFVPGRDVEGGGELIGSNHPTWAAYAKKFGLEFLDIVESDNTAPIELGGKILSDTESSELWDAMDKASKLMDRESDGVVEDEPWKTPNAEALDKRTVADWLAGIDVPDAVKNGVGAQLISNNGVALVKQSYLGQLTQVKAAAATNTGRTARRTTARAATSSWRRSWSMGSAPSISP
jgi:monoamine oxidase